MARPLRIEFPGALYHVMARGNARGDIVRNDTDRAGFVSLLAEVVARHRVICHAYCLMDNHYHLLLETPEGNLGRALRDLNGRYTQWFNRRHRRVGHLFQGRYKAILVEKDSYLLEVSRYIVLNPVRAGRCKRADGYAWSSYRATAGRYAAPDWLETRTILQCFAVRRAAATMRYAEFVAQGVDAAPLAQTRGQILLGSDAFVAQMAGWLQPQRHRKAIPREQRYVDRPTLAELFRDRFIGKAQRNAQVVRACREYGYRQSEVARQVGLSEATVSAIVRRKCEE